jgi:hypothetical protein
MKPRRAKTTAGIYVILDEHGCIIKVGYNQNLMRRLQRYVEKGIAANRFHVILDLDNTDDVTNDALEELYNRVKQDLLACDELHPFQKYFFRVLFERHGERLGAKVTFVLQMLECGYQTLWGLPCLMEFLMFDKTVCNLWYQDTANWSRKLLALLPTAVRKAGLEGRLILLIISS